jgi:hypothetical protein
MTTHIATLEHINVMECTKTLLEVLIINVFMESIYEDHIAKGGFIKIKKKLQRNRSAICPVIFFKKY